MYASAKGYLAVVRILIKAGADVHHANKHGDTALIFASTIGNVNVIRTLLDAGANVKHANQDGHTALMKARTHARQHRGAVRTLLLNQFFA